MSLVQTERVLVVSTELFQSCGYFQGFSPNAEQYLPTLLDPKVTKYLPRDQMEQDPSFKQLIPYCVFQYTDQFDTEHVFQYTRGSGQGEARLHAKKSIGIGGHISTLDEHADSAYLEGMNRELEEEVIIDTPFKETCVGMINDDENEVGKVHLGVVHLIKVEQPLVKAREVEIEGAGFQPVAEILTEIDKYETWSQICLRALFDQSCEP